MNIAVETVQRSNMVLSPRQREIYDNLLKYTQEGETFYKVDHVWKGRVYRIFSYRLASYTEFMKPDALEGRGIMFEMDGETPVRLACRPMHKFFNLHENPSTMNLNTASDNIEIVMDKVDGSLISTWLDHEGELQLKSKTSLTSGQVELAWKYLKANSPRMSNTTKPYDYSLLSWLKDYATTNVVTVNMEYIGPDNRIVVGYEDASLRVLNTRDLEPNEDEYDLSMHGWPDHPLYGYAGGALDDANEFDLKALNDTTGIEGYVVVLKSGEWFKVKTPWYSALHKTKDSINSKKKLFECIVCETSDDLKALFYDDPLALKLIADMEAIVIPKFDHFVNLVETFYENNKGLERKDYAIKGQQELRREVFSLAMSKYLGREVNYKEWAVKHIELFGVKDEPTEKAVEE